MAYVISEHRKSDFEADEFFVHHVLYLNAGDAGRAAKLALGSATRDAIEGDMVDDPGDVKFDLSEWDNVKVDGCGWSATVEVWEVA